MHWHLPAPVPALASYCTKLAGAGTPAVNHGNHVIPLAGRKGHCHVLGKVVGPRPVIRLGLGRDSAITRRAAMTPGRDPRCRWLIARPGRLDAAKPKAEIAVQIVARCRSTVAVLMNSSAAICLLLSPAASSRSTSAWRPVRLPGWGPAFCGPAPCGSAPCGRGEHPAAYAASPTSSAIAASASAARCILRSQRREPVRPAAGGAPRHGHRPDGTPGPARSWPRPGCAGWPPACSAPRWRPGSTRRPLPSSRRLRAAAAPWLQRIVPMSC